MPKIRVSAPLRTRLVFRVLCFVFCFFSRKEFLMLLEHAEHRRDLRLRKRILRLLHAARVRPEEGGWAQGRFIVDVIIDTFPGSRSFTDDDHALGLLHDLRAGGYVRQRDDRTKKYQPRSLDFTSFCITHKGVALVEEQIDPDPLVDDDRVRARRTPRDPE
jgi:hypothetical protein